jgi:hypothetical protein
MSGKSFDLDTSVGVQAFVASLRLDPRRAGAVEHVLDRASDEERGQVAHLAAVFAEAEVGGAIPSRLVISAHSGGAFFFGEHGFLRPESVQALARAMPHAGAQIRDLHFSACSSSGQASLERNLAEWRRAFPNLETIWAYTGSTGRPDLTGHLRAWASATGKPHHTLDLPPSLARQHIATWSAKAGYHDEMTLGELRGAQRQADAEFDALFSGETSATSDDPDVLWYYETYRLLSQRSDLRAEERADMTKKADQLLRLRYYAEGVRVDFAGRFGDDIRGGFVSLGRTPPRFGELSRQRALAEIDAFEQRLARESFPPAEAAKLSSTLAGFKHLEPSTVPESTCRHLR